MERSEARSIASTPLGQMLRRRSWISGSQLDAARQRQSQLGGRLGTAFLELGLLAEPLLVEALSEQLGVPAADAEDLRDIPADVIAKLPASTAARAEAIPFRNTASRLDVALMDVRDLALHDELSFIAGKRVKVYIANEARIFEALARYYGQKLPTRFRHLLERLNRDPGLPPEPRSHSDSPRQPTAPAPAPERRAASSTAPAQRGPQPPEPPRSIELTESERRELEGAARAADAGPTAPPDPLGRALDRAERPGEVAAALLDDLEGQFERVVLFSVRRGQVRGWFGRGRGIVRDRLRAFQSDLTERSIFQEMDTPGQLFTGVLAPLPAHLRLHDALGGSAAHECLLQPIRVRGRLAAILYADRGGAGLEELDVGHVMRLAGSAGAALERCVLRRKLGPAEG